MQYFMQFKDNNEYAKYLKSDAVSIPRVSYILNDHIQYLDEKGRDTSIDKDDWSQTKDTSTGLPKGGDNKRWVDYTTTGQHFIEISEGVMHFYDVYDKEKQERYTARVDENGALIIQTPNSSYDPSTGTITIINYPDDIYSNKSKFEI